MKKLSGTVSMISFHAWTHNRTRNQKVIKNMANEMLTRGQTPCEGEMK